MAKQLPDANKQAVTPYEELVPHYTRIIDDYLDDPSAQEAGAVPHDQSPEKRQAPGHYSNRGKTSQITSDSR